MGKTDLISKSIMDNVKRFVDPLTDKQLNELCAFMLFNFIEDQPTALQRRFVDEFFGADRWDSFVKESRKQTGVKWIDLQSRSIVQDIRGYLNFYQTLRFEEVVKEGRWKKRFNDLKKAAAEAVKNSEEDGVFCKIEGWCNIYEVLTDHGVLKRVDE